MATLVSSTSDRAETEADSHMTSFEGGAEPEPPGAATTTASREEASAESSAEAETSEAVEESPHEMHGRGVRLFTGKDGPKDQVYCLHKPAYCSPRPRP